MLTCWLMLRQAAEGDRAFTHRPGVLPTRHGRVPVQRPIHWTDSHPPEGPTGNGPWTDVADPVTDNMVNFAGAIKLTTTQYIRVTYPGSPPMYPMSALPIAVKIT